MKMLKSTESTKASSIKSCNYEKSRFWFSLDWLNPSLHLLQHFMEKLFFRQSSSSCLRERHFDRILWLWNVHDCISLFLTFRFRSRSYILWMWQSHVPFGPSTITIRHYFWRWFRLVLPFKTIDWIYYLWTTSQITHSIIHFV